MSEDGRFLPIPPFLKMIDSENAYPFSPAISKGKG